VSLDLASLGQFYRSQLMDNCLPFWFPRAVDSIHGGFWHCVDRDGSLVDTDKSVWAQGRMTWMLLTLYNSTQSVADLLEWGEQGLRFLDQHGFDVDGRMFFHVTQEGRPIRKRRYAYSEAFAALAFAVHAKATDHRPSAERARQLFLDFTRWNFTPNMMPPKFSDERPQIGIGPRMITIHVAQELRSNLGDDGLYRSWIDRCIDEIERLFVHPEQQVVMETVSPRGDIIDHFDGRTLNPGHAIEGAWFILHEGQYRNDQRLVQLGCQMLDWMLERGWDQEYGGLYCFRDVYGKPVQEYWHDMKFWWPHNEALIATLLAYCLTGEPRYATWHTKIKDWSFDHFADPEFGEWFGYLHRDGRLSTTIKGNLWKSFYHYPRSLWYCWQLCDASRK
jgi:N-acylglucosamine 2-epimerase